MTLDFWMNLIDGQPELSLLLTLSAIIIALYIARQTAHQIILLLTRSIRNALRIMSHSVMHAEKRLQSRNREVILAQGNAHAERYIEREFQRVEVLVNRDLSGYPSLQRDLKEQITRIDEDYVQSGEIPPKPPEWLKAIEAVANIPDNGSPIVAKILNDIHGTLKKALDKDMQEYRQANRERHSLLKRMMPCWRTLTNNLNSVERKITGLEQRSIIIDGQMQSYEEIRSQTDYAERILSSSSITQFFISGLALSLAVVGMYVNFQLVALPLEEMVGASSYLGSSTIQASDVSALFIVSIEVMLGLFLMESIGITQLFPIIYLLEDHRRKIIFWVMLSFLFVFASIEASLAYMRDILAADREALSQLLTGVEVAEPPLRWIPSFGQMVMGFILPFVLTFVAIPLESFIQSLRTVGGIIFGWLLRMLVVLIRFTSSLVQGVGRMTVNVYDLFIFIPLKIESLIVKEKSTESEINAALTHQQEKIEEK